MTNPYIEYYRNQAGSGVTVYEGLQYQRGHGFFGTLFSNVIKPLTKYFGKRALETGVKVGSDVLEGEDFKDSLKKNFKLTGNRVLDDGVEKLKKFTQSGSGRRRRRRKPKLVAMLKKLHIKGKKKKSKSFKKKLSKKTKQKKSKKPKVSKKRKKSKKRSKNSFKLF